MNKYLEKIAANEKKLENPNYYRMAGSAATSGAVGALIGNVAKGGADFLSGLLLKNKAAKLGTSAGNITKKLLDKKTMLSSKPDLSNMGDTLSSLSKNKEKADKVKNAVTSGIIKAPGKIYQYGMPAAYAHSGWKASKSKQLKEQEALNKKASIETSNEQTDIPLEKIALNALARVLSSGTRGLSTAAHSAQIAAAGSTMAKATKNLVSKGATRSAATNIASKAVNANSGKIPSSFLSKAVSNSGADPLATPLRDRLAAHRNSLGLKAANGDRAIQIENANKLREARKAGKLNLVGSKPIDNPGNLNAANINKALVDSKAGHQTHVDFKADTKSNTVSSTVNSSRPDTPANNTLLTKAKSLLSKGKNFSSSPLGKKVTIGAAAAGVGAVGYKALKGNQEDQYQYSYS